MDQFATSAQSDESGYQMPLPTPAALKLLTTGLGGAVSDVTHEHIAELEKSNGSITGGQIGVICDQIIAQIEVPNAGESIASPPDGLDRWGKFDLFFAVERIPESAGKENLVKALVVAVAMVMKNTAALEAGATGVSPVEFGLLRQCFGVIIESLEELSTKN